MQKDIVQKIDLLVEMTDTNNSYETLKEELNLLEKEIETQKNKINRLKKTMENRNYMNSSDRIIDENIKIGLENKLSSYEQSMVDIVNEIESISKEEESYHQMILDLEKEIHTSKSFLESLELKLKTIGGKDKSVYSFYEDLIDATTKEIKSNETRLQVKKKAYEQVSARLESYGEKRFDLEEKMKKDHLKLEETLESLATPDAYIDEKSKELDENKLSQMESELEKLEKRRLEIITDPTFIGRDAMDLLSEDDRTSCLDKVRELVTIVNSKPYMDFRYEELDEILENAKQQRDEFANAIDGKKYDGTDNQILESRIEFLKDAMEKKKQEQVELEQKIREMDTTMVQNLMNHIKDAKEMRDKLKVDIEEYKKVMDENNDYKSPKKKASLNAAFHRKCDELDEVVSIIDSYQKDLEKIVETSKKLESEDLEGIRLDLRKMEEELKIYEKQKMIDTYANDILAIEKDKSELKKLSDEVSKIEHRKKYLKTPNEIYDEIEIALSEEKMPEEVETEEESVNLNDYRIDPIEEEYPVESLQMDEEPQEQTEVKIEEPKEEVVDEVLPTVPSMEEEIPEELPVEESPLPMSEYEENAPIEMSEVFPPRNTPMDNPNLIKVISVEPIDEEEKEVPVPTTVEVQPVESTPIQNDDFIVNNDYEDTDYISFNELLEGSMKDGNQN